MAGLQIEIPAATSAVSLAIAKLHCRLTSDLEDDLIGLYIEAATEDAEDFTSRSFVNKGYVEVYDSFPYFTDTIQSQLAYPPAYYSLPRYSTTLWNYSQMVKILRSPLSFVDRIDYISSQDGSLQTLRPILENWQPGVEYFVGDEIEDSNGNLQQVTAVAETETPPVEGETIEEDESDEEASAVSGTSAPIWSQALNGAATDEDLTWTCKKMPAGDFYVDRISEPPRIFPGGPGNFWPSVLYVPNAVQIHYTAGYGSDATAVPAKAKVAILQAVAHWYENRESVSPLDLKKVPEQAERLLMGSRVWDLAPTRG